MEFIGYHVLDVITSIRAWIGSVYPKSRARAWRQPLGTLVSQCSLHQVRSDKSCKVKVLSVFKISAKRLPLTIEAKRYIPFKPMARHSIMHSNIGFICCAHARLIVRCNSILRIDAHQSFQAQLAEVAHSIHLPFGYRLRHHIY